MRTEEAWTERYAVLPPVYCQRCRFFREVRRRTAAPAFVCRHPAARYQHLTFRGSVTLRRGPEERNARNDCPDFVAVSWHDYVWRFGACLLIGGALVLLHWFGRLGG